MALEDQDKYRFRYVRTAGGKLPGASMIIQTEQALSEIGNTALENTEDTLTMAQEALAKSETAINTAQNASADASEALTIAKDARERAINANDAATQAQKTADEAVANAAAAQATADGAQSTADYAQETAESALELARQADTKAEAAQSTADTADSKADAAQEAAATADAKAEAAQTTADGNSDSIVNLEAELATTEETLRQEIDKMGFYFELDESAGEDIDSITTELTKKYYTQDVMTAPEGVSAPYWFWNFVRDDGEKTVQWLRTVDGVLYSRDGEVTPATYEVGSDAFDGISVPGQSEGLGISFSVDEDGTMTLEVSGSGSLLSSSYSSNTGSATISIPLEDETAHGEITYGGAVLGTLEDGVVTNAEGAKASGTHCTLEIDGGDVVDGVLSLYVVVTWNDYTPASAVWEDWSTLSGGDISSSTLAVQVVGATPNCYRRAALPEGHQTYVTVFANTQVNIDGKGYISTEDVNLYLDDVASASARAGTDMYIYACAPTAGTEPTFVLSLNSTVPDGYTADNSRKIGGFHCLCLAVGTISGHTLSGYATGDVLPLSIWDLRHRATSDNEGMTYDERGFWVDIYISSWNGEQLVSEFGGSPVLGTSAKPMHAEMFNEEYARIKKRLLTRAEYVMAARGTVAQDVDRLGELPSTLGGHTLTKGYRAISNIGIEDPFGVYYQWTANVYGAFNATGSSTTYQYGGGNTSVDNYYLQGFGWDTSSRVANDSIDGDRSMYGNNYGVMAQFLVGGCGTTAQANCGSRCVSMNNLSARVSSNYGCRAAAERRVEIDV